MGLWSLLFGGSDQRAVTENQSRGTSHPPTINGDGTYETEVVGESNYQDALWRAVRLADADERGYRHRTTALLQSEPSNPYDRNAIQVLIEDRIVGYLSREDAVTHQPLMATHD